MIKSRRSLREVDERLARVEIHLRARPFVTTSWVVFAWCIRENRRLSTRIKLFDKFTSHLGRYN